MRMRKIGKTALKKAGRDERKGRKLFADSFQNFSLKLGLGTDNALNDSTYGFNPITRVRTLLEWIHRGSWLGGVAVDLVADDMTRGGMSIISSLEPTDMEIVDQTIVQLGIWPAINDVVKWARLYGGAIGMIMIDGQDLSTPLKIDRIGPEQFKGILPLDRWQVNPSMNDLVGDMGPNFAMPRFYDTAVDSAGLPRMKIHYTRVLRMEGIRMPHWQRVMEQLWGVSIYERLYDRLVAFDSATAGAAQSLYRSYLRTYKIKDLRAIAASNNPSHQDGLAKYVDMMRKFQSIEGVTLLDLGDEFEEGGSSQSLAGHADMMLRFGEQLSGALQIPLVRLFGQSPAGLNSSGESDLRTYYDGINQQQERWLRNPMEAIYRLISISAGIELPDDFKIQFNPLWQMQDKDKVNAGNQYTQAVTGAVDAGLVHPATALKELRQSARITGMWSNISDEEIEAAESMPTPQEQAEHQQEVEMTQAENSGTNIEGGEHTHGSEFHGGGATVQEGEHFHEAPKVPRGGGGPPGAGGKGPPGAGGKKAPPGAGGGKPKLTAIAGGKKKAAGDSAPPPGFDITVNEGEEGAKPAGFLRGTCSTEGGDQNMDCFVGPHQASDSVFLIYKNGPGGRFEQNHAMLCYNDINACLTDFGTIYGTEAVGGVESMSSGSFERFLASYHKAEGLK